MKPPVTTSGEGAGDAFSTRRRAAFAAIGTLTVLLALVHVPGAIANDAGVRITDAQCDAPDHLGPENENLVHEWIEITNVGEHTVDLTGWRLHDAGARFVFGDDVDEGELDGDVGFLAFALEPSASVKVRTGVGDDNATDLFWDRGSAVWNDDGDTAHLLDPDGNEVSRLVCGEGGTPTPRDEEDEHEEPTPAAACVTGLVAVALDDRSVDLSWDAVAGAHFYHVHHVEVGGRVGALVAVVPGNETTYLHQDLEFGLTLRYAVAANGHPTEACASAETTVIPFFPGVGATVLAALGAVGAVLLVRRSR